MPLRSPEHQPERHLARFKGGPLHGSTRRISGRPPAFLPVSTPGAGIYTRAGAADPEGRLPYWWLRWDPRDV